MAETRILLCDDCELTPTLELCRKHGLGIEVQSFYDPVNYTDEVIGKHARALAGVAPVALHAPFADLCPGSLDGEVRMNTEARFVEACEVAEILNIKKLIFHNGYVPGTSHLENYVGRAVLFWNYFLPKIAPDIEIFLENHLETEPAMLIDVVDAVEGGRLFINLDVGHVNTASKMSVLQWIEKCGKRIKYMHLHDNHGQKEEYLPLGQGNIPFAEVFTAVRQYCGSPYLALESGVPTLEESLARLKECWGG